MRIHEQTTLDKVEQLRVDIQNILSEHHDNPQLCEDLILYKSLLFAVEGWDDITLHNYIWKKFDENKGVLIEKIP